MSPWRQTESKRELNPQLEIGDTCVLVFVTPAWSSSATGKRSFQLFQRPLHENLRLHPPIATPPFSQKFGCERIDSSSRSPPIKPPLRNTCKVHLGLLPPQILRTVELSKIRILRRRLCIMTNIVACVPSRALRHPCQLTRALNPPRGTLVSPPSRILPDRTYPPSA